MAEKLGIKETKEAVAGVMELAVLLAARLKDGVQLGDVVAVYDKLKDDAEFQAKLLAAYGGVGAVPAEVKDLDLMESVELVTVIVPYVPKVADALKK